MQKLNDPAQTYISLYMYIEITFCDIMRLCNLNPFFGTLLTFRFLILHLFCLFFFLQKIFPRAPTPLKETINETKKKKIRRKNIQLSSIIIFFFSVFCYRFWLYQMGNIFFVHCEVLTKLPVNTKAPNL